MSPTPISGKRLTVIAALLTFLSACTSEAPPRNSGNPDGEEDKPNVLVIVSDDERLGKSLAVMPKLRRWMVSGGTTFTSAFATTPLCCPSRASIMTGRYAHNHGVLRNELGSLLDPATTLQSSLREAGYQTAIAGKYLQGVSLMDDPSGFDRWALMLWGYYGARFNLDGKSRFVRRYSTDFLASRARRYMRRFESLDDEPWFLYVAPFAPHTPYTPKRKYESADVPALERTEAFGGGREGRSFGGGRVYTPNEASRAYKDQLRTLMSTDDLVDDLFRQMARLEESQNTLVVYMSDNGFMFGEYGLFAKRVPYDPATRIPLFVRWPGHVQSDVTDNRLVGNIDVAPTILEAAGVVDDVPRDGTSLLEDGEVHDHLVLEGWRKGPANRRNELSASLQWLALRSSEYLYVENYPRRGDEAESREYYDLVSDPLALRNLLTDPDPSNDPDVGSLASRLQKDRECSGESCP